MNCPICQSNMRLIPSGFSKKTGKPYQAFYGCSVRECKGTAQVSKPVERFEASLDADTQQKRIDKAVEEKRKNISWLNAKTNAVNLIMKHKMFEELEAKAIKVAIKKWTEWIDELEPKDDFRKDLDEQKRKNEEDAELESIGESVDASETPF